MITISVCVGSACHKRGSYALMKRLCALCEKYAVSEQVAVVPAFCLGMCGSGISLKIGDRLYSGVSSENAEKLFHEAVLPNLEGGMSHGNSAI